MKKTLPMNVAFTLIEIMIAVTIFFVGIVGFFSLIVFSINTSAFNVDNFIAGQLAQEGLELVRNLRDKNWHWLFFEDWQAGLQDCQLGCEMDYNDTFLSSYSNRFLKIDSTGFYNYEEGQNSKFKRKITIIPQNGFLNVAVEIFWGASESYKAQDNLSDWFNAGS